MTHDNRKSVEERLAELLAVHGDEFSREALGVLLALLDGRMPDEHILSDAERKERFGDFVKLVERGRFDVDQLRLSDEMRTEGVEDQMQHSGSTTDDSNRLMLRYSLEPSLAAGEVAGVLLSTSTGDRIRIASSAGDSYCTMTLVGFRELLERYEARAVRLFVDTGEKTEVVPLVAFDDRGHARFKKEDLESVVNGEATLEVHFVTS